MTPLRGIYALFFFHVLPIVLCFSNYATTNSSQPSNAIHQSASDSAPTTTSSGIYIEPPAFTGGVYRVSANKLSFPTDISDTIDQARAEKSALDIFAVHLNISAPTTYTTFLGYTSANPHRIVLTNITRLRIMAHTCTFSNPRLSILIDGRRETRLPAPASIGRTPARGFRGFDSGDIEVFCDNIKSDAPVEVLFYLRGSAGGSGQRGGNGRNGRDGTLGVVGRCRTERFLGIRTGCDTTRGRAGITSTMGDPGARGSDGGAAGDGGNFVFQYKRKTEHPINIRTYVGAGAPGRAGNGGFPGRNGRFIEPIRYVTGCSSGCNPRTTLENRPALTSPGFGGSGRNGPTGVDGSSMIMSPPTTATFRQTSFADEDFHRFSILAQRYYGDLVLADSASCPESISVMETISMLSSYRPGSNLLKYMSDRAEMTRKAVQLQKALFGPATLSRTASITISEELRRDLNYGEAVKDQMELAKLTSTLTSAITAAASISIPSTDFAELRRNLVAQRNIFAQAVFDLESRLQGALSTIQFEVEGHVLARQDEQERQRRRARFKAVLSVVNIGVGLLTLDVTSLVGSTTAIIGSIRDIQVSYDSISEAFGEIGEAIDEVKPLLDDVTDIADKIGEVREAFSDSERAGCDFNDIRGLLVAAPDRIDKFPNLVDINSDFSKIRDIGVVADLSSALLETRASSLTGQFSCVFGENLEDIPSLKSVFDNYFILAASRIDILGRMTDIDVELQQLRVTEAGIEAQRDNLRVLERNSRTVSRSSALVSMSVVFEFARMRVIETIERLATSYSNIALRNLRGVVRSYARNRLQTNGAVGFDASGEFANVVRLEGDLKRAFRRAHSCVTSREVPTVGYYSFDITEENTPELFGRMGTGPHNRSAVVLDINEHCAVYGGNQPPARGLEMGDNRAFCLPNEVTYNARMVGISLELIGGDESLLPAGRSKVVANIDQAGLQTFHAKPRHYKKFGMEPLQFSVGFTPLRASTPGGIVYHGTCLADVGGLTDVNLDAPRVCPSPFSGYSIQLGAVAEPGLHAYLGSLQAVRIHTRLVAYTRAATATTCFDE